MNSWSSSNIFFPFILFLITNPSKSFVNNILLPPPRTKMSELKNSLDLTNSFIFSTEFISVKYFDLILVLGEVHQRNKLHLYNLDLK